MVDHPLTASNRPEIPGTTQVPIRYRPRFTMLEALLLNLLVNAHPGWISLDEINHQIGRYSPNGRMSRAAIMVRIAVLRAKLGDPAWHPVQIISVKRRPDDDIGNDRLVGYYWNDPEHPHTVEAGA